MKNITNKYFILLLSVLSLILVTCVENHILPNFGSIFISSDPEGAEVFLDNTKKGVTPLTLNEILSGDYNISITMDEFVDSSFDVHVAENQNVTYDVFLDEQNPKGKISLTSDPEGARIFINGNDTQQLTPASFSNLERGVYNIKLSLELYDDSNFKIDLEKDETIEKNTKMIIAGSSGALFITSTPSGATIFLDEFNTGKVTPDTLNPLAAGVYSIRLSLDAYRDTTVSATVASGTTTNTNVDLTFYEPRGSITLNSNPQGAKIIIDDNDTGLFTPNTIKKLEAGNYEIRLELDQYFDSTFTVAVLADQNTDWPLVDLVEIPFIISVTVNPAEGGSVSGDGGYLDGAQATLVANPNIGYHFVNWTENSSVISSNVNYVFSVNKDRNLVANFELNVYQISASVNPDLAGSITGTGEYRHGDNVNISVSTNIGYRFVNWTENGSGISTETSLSFTAESDRNLIANFVEIGNLIVSSDPSGADIYINDSFSGKKTPYEFQDILAGEYVVTLKLEDFADTSITTSIFSGETSEINDVFLRDITPDVEVEITYTVNENQSLSFFFTFNQDIIFSRINIITPENKNNQWIYGGISLTEGVRQDYNVAAKISGEWVFTFFGRKVDGRKDSFEFDKTITVE